jgi:hypothetical protein
MKPFPTSFWLVCPHLLKIVGRMESEGGIPEMERASQVRWNDWVEYHLMHAVLRLSMIARSERAFLRMRHSAVFRAICGRGAGGMRYSKSRVFVKCLHLQTASYLGFGRHPMSEWLLGRIGDWECGEALCAST